MILRSADERKVIIPNGENYDRKGIVRNSVEKSNSVDGVLGNLPVGVTGIQFWRIEQRQYWCQIIQILIFILTMVVAILLPIILVIIHQ